ncbi:hypothetical protein ACIRJS_45205 [Streptomyces sp. NPDC102340]
MPQPVLAQVTIPYQRSQRNHVQAMMIARGIISQVSNRERMRSSVRMVPR